MHFKDGASVNPDSIVKLDITEVAKTYLKPPTNRPLLIVSLKEIALKEGEKAPSAEVQPAAPKVIGGAAKKKPLKGVGSAKKEDVTAKRVLGKVLASSSAGKKSAGKVSAAKGTPGKKPPSAGKRSTVKPSQAGMPLGKGSVGKKATTD